MLKKIRLLIIASILGLLALSLVQGFLINNTYKLKKDVFISDTRKSISRIDDLSPSLDSVNDIWQNHFLNLVADYYVKKISKEQILEKLNRKTDSINENYIKKYQKEIATKNIGYKLKFQKKVKTIILLDSLGIKNDTIFESKTKPSFLLLGANFTEEEGHRVSNSLWMTDHNFQREINGKKESITFDLQFETQDRMNIDGWEKIVLRRMTSLLILSVIIFLFVFGLLYYSIKNLITQKKIADIKTDFVNNITHELKTPLATLNLATKMLQKEEIKTQPIIIESTINTIERQNIRLQKLIDQVLNNSLGYQEIKLNKEVVNTNDYLNMIVDDFQLSLDSKSIKFNKNISVNNEILIDKFYFTTAVLNILENAVKYGKEDLEIHISATTKENFTISIKDNGIGIPKKQQQFLFDKFYRVGNKEVHNVKGLGLGLYYTHQIIKAHKGGVFVESEENIGTTFTIQIPLK
ncbi:HAMP domain-containing histidine kinase [Polaribacter haliotis]|uniref:histidine kinase n=1 Tax=Polaribacter haliotis TaxID=1888915 RepID=A0A7L8AIS9_9FLAO|nr:HAMP domain-containing sensor histidine kinase [Polaribacter haliotis]QOD61902.1 HAMP domain-containing histidine kinase [Polaribacter haliotis]